jgi:hypothetical protein
LLDPVLLLQDSAMCFIEVTLSVLPEALPDEGVPLCAPELGLAEPEALPADELLVVPVICTSWPTCACSWLVSPVKV